MNRVQRGPVAYPLLRKSHTGCKVCRQRKVKCDEVRPVCSNCARRFTNIASCDYAGPPSREPSRPHKRFARATDAEGPKSAIAPGALRPGPSLRPTAIEGTNQWRSVELRLMHHYTTVVSRKMPDCNGQPARLMWEQTIPQLSFDSEVVLNPLLALAALHYHAHSPNDSLMSLAITRYVDRALAKHREAIDSFDGDLGEQVWLSAVILSNMYWLIAHQTRPNEDYELPIQFWKLMHGVSLLFFRRQSFLAERGYAWFGHEEMPLCVPKDRLPAKPAEQLRAIEADVSVLFTRFGVHTLPDQTRNTYIEARDYVLHHYQAYFSGANVKTIRRFIGTMALRCQANFRRLLEAHDPLAMALFARLLVMLTGFEYAWWMNGQGDYEVVKRDILGMREIMPANLRWAMEWPCKVLSGDIDLARTPLATDSREGMKVTATAVHI